MSKVSIRIAELEAVLTNHKDEYEGYDLANMEEELFQLRHINDLRDRFSKIPIANDCIQTEFHGFPEGTSIYEVRFWFMDRFSTSLINDF